MEAAPPGFRRGFGEAFERFGMPFRTFEIADVNGWFFGTFAPVAEEDLPEPVAVAERALDTRPWRGIADEWMSSVRRQFLWRNGALQAVDPGDLDDRGLIAHLASTLELFHDGLARHFLQAGAHWVGVGLLVHEAGTLAGWPPERVMQALVGASPTSIAPLGGLRRIADAIASDTRASAILAGDAEPRTALAELRACSRAITAALDDYLDEYGWQVFTGFDFTHAAMIELPALLLATIRSVAAPGHRDGDEVAKLRAAVPSGARTHFEGLLDDALVTYGLRDDDSGITVQRPLGLVRRAVLEAGRRLAARGALHDRDDAFDATSVELAALLTGAGRRPSADELCRRAARRRPPFPTPPRRLGDGAPPDEKPLPPAMERIVGALFAAVALEDTGESGERVAGSLQGAGASPGVYEGRARVIRGLEDFERIEKGDVLVASITTPAYNVVLPLLGAVITDRGGVLSHPAIVAREFGIPAVVGAGSATRTIPDGTRVRVDGTRGTVSLLG